MSITPERIMQFGWAFVPQRSLTAAIDIGLFTALDRGAGTLDELVAATGASPRGVRIIADALAGLGLLVKENGRYANAPDAAKFLVQGKPSYLGPLIQHVDLLWERFGRLTEVVRSGEPAMALDEQAPGEEFFTELVPAIFCNSYPQGCAAAEYLGAGNGRSGLRILDVAAGAAAWSLPFMERDASATTVAVDYESVLRVTRQFAERFGCADRYEYRAGSIRELDFGRAEFDVALFGHICHSEGAEWSRRLIDKTARALKPGGKLVIGDMIPDEERREATFPLLFAVNMLVHTSDGDCFTMSEYQAWLDAAGFQRVETVDNPGPSPLIVATR